MLPPDFRRKLLTALGYVVLGILWIAGSSAGWFEPVLSGSPRTPQLIIFVMGLLAITVLLWLDWSSRSTAEMETTSPDEKTPEERKAWIRARYDTTTGLSNRWWFFQQVQDHIDTVDNDDGDDGFVLVIVDLVGLNTVNDYYGHEMGNRLLEKSGRWLQRKVEKSGLSDVLLGHLGADEFGIMIPYEGPAPDRNRIRELIEPLHYTFRLADVELNQAFNAGVAYYPRDGSNLKAILGGANRALERGKEKSRRHVTFYEATDRQELNRRIEAENYIKKALDNHALDIFYQSIVDAKSRDVIMQEALVRTRTEEGDNQAPTQLQSISKQPRLCRTFDRYILKKVIEEIRPLIGETSFPRVTVNLLPPSLLDWSFLKEINELLVSEGFPRDRFILEISEKVLLSHAERVFRNVRQADELGLRFGLDDFGVGFGSFKILKTIPLDLLKIDGSFVKGLKDDPVNQNFIKSLALLGKELDLPVVGEWIETEATADLLTQLGVNYHQGFYYDVPAPTEA